MIVVTTEQRTDAWRQARVGYLSGSVAGDMLARIKTGEAAKRRDLRVRLAVERITGVSAEDGYVNRDMQRGIDLEAKAIAHYEAITGQLVKPVGFLAHDDLLAGCSPDGIVGDFRGLVEVKCPRSAAHFEVLRTRSLPSEYVGQITHNLWITGAQWADFVSFDDRFPPNLRVCVVRVPRKQAEIDAYALMAQTFLAEVDRDVAEIRGLIEVAA